MTLTPLTLLAPSATDLFSPNGPALWDRLREMKDAGVCKHIGVPVYASDDPVLRELDQLGLGLIEQPLSPDSWLEHGVLARQFHTAICLDESIRCVADMRLARHFGAADVINIKPSRVGGVRAAQQIVNECVDAQMGAWVGGMLDLGINRAVNLAVAALDGCGLPGDISATDRYFDRDITEPFVLDRSGGIAVPQGLGIGVDVDVEAVASCTVESITLR